MLLPKGNTKLGTKSESCHHRTLLLVRHGDYLPGRLESDGRLNARGTEQSRSTAAAIKDMRGLPPIRRID